MFSPSSFRHKYEFLHNSWSPDLRITVNPVRIGVALDYDRGTLSFFNVDLEQHLHTFNGHFRNYVQPCFGMDNPGALTVHNGIEAPEYAFIWHQLDITLILILTKVLGDQTYQKRVASDDDKCFSVVFIIVFHGNRHTPFSKIRKSFTEFYNMYLYHQQLQQTKCLN